MKHAALDDHFELSPPQVLALQRFANLLATRAISLGLIAEADRERMLERHVVDSLRASRLFGPDHRLAVDLGSGAGLPGLALAVALPKCRFVLIEARARRAAFLELAVDELGVENVEVLRARVEDVVLAADVATARAFAPLAGAWKAAHRLLRRGGRLIYFAGGTLTDPLEEAATLRSPEPPSAVEIARVLENATPLVMMTRG